MPSKPTKNTPIPTNTLGKGEGTASSVAAVPPTKLPGASSSSNKAPKAPSKAASGLPSPGISLHQDEEDPMHKANPLKASDSIATTHRPKMHKRSATGVM